MATRTKTQEIPSVAGGDARIEEYLDSKGIQWTFHPKVGADQFDADASLRNQVRFQAVDDAVVEQYTEAMRRGDKFPPVIAHKSGKHNLFVNADGNHRLQAALKARKPLGVYDITGTPGPLITLVASEINTRHGRPTSEAERIHQALFLLENGATIASAAAAVNLPKRIVEKASQRQSTNARFAECGIPALTVEKLADTVKWRLSHISTDEGFVAATELALAANLGSDQTFEIVTKINEQRSSARQVAVVADLRADMLGAIQESGGGTFTSQQTGKRMMGPRTRVGGALSNLLALPEDISQVGRMYVGAEREEVAKKAREAAKVLKQLADELSK